MVEEVRVNPRLRLGLLLIAVLGITPLGTRAQDGDGGFLVLAGGRLIDGTGAEPVADAAVVIRGSRIVYAGPSADIELPTGAEVIDVGGLTVLPGFINAHVHGGTDPSNLEAWAWQGVTTVRDLGATAATLRRFRNLHPPTPERARLVAAGPLITVPGGYPTVPFGSSTAAPILSAEDARRLAEELLDNGADLLKLALETGTVFGRNIPIMSLAEASMLVRVAHGRGTVASAHITSVVDIDLALDAGVDDLAHMAVDRTLPDETLERLVGQGVLWVPTLELWQCTGQSSMAVGNLRRFVRAGGVVALGTDFEGYNCSWDLGMPMTEIGLMERAGMSAMEIIVSGTRNAARVCNLGRDLGTVEAGKIADVVLVRGDPLSRLGALREVRLVIRDGVVIRDGLAAQRRQVPRRRAFAAR
jgi:imidazolonepropionase-like amidohydrolase